jgi:hypothetical protein
MRCQEGAVVIWRSYSRHYFAMSALGWEPHAVMVLAIATVLARRHQCGGYRK